MIMVEREIKNNCSIRFICSDYENRQNCKYFKPTEFNFFALKNIMENASILMRKKKHYWRKQNEPHTINIIDNLSSLSQMEI